MDIDSRIPISSRIARQAEPEPSAARRKRPERCGQIERKLTKNMNIFDINIGAGISSARLWRTIGNCWGLRRRARRSTSRSPILDEPTRGVDASVISQIHAAIRRLSDENKAVVVISSYLPEILAISDRILVACGGRIVKEMAREDATENKIMQVLVRLHIRRTRILIQTMDGVPASSRHRAFATRARRLSV